MSRTPVGHNLHGMRRIVSLGLLLVVACGGGVFGPPMPVGLGPTDSATVSGWVAATRATGPVMMRFRFTYRDEKGTAKGRGSAIILPPDSLRFDFAGPLGSNRSAAMVVGDSGHWAIPEDQVAKLVPSYPILWAMLGQARFPDPADTLRALVQGDVTAWRYASGGDTVEYLRTSGATPQLVVDVREQGRRIGRVVTDLSPAGQPLRARLSVPSKPARVDLEFYRHEPLTDRPDSLWVRPSDES